MHPLPHPACAEEGTGVPKPRLGAENPADAPQGCWGATGGSQHPALDPADQLGSWSSKPLMEAGGHEPPHRTAAAAPKCPTVFRTVSVRKGFCPAPCMAPTLHAPHCSQTPMRCWELLRVLRDGRTGAWDHEAHPGQGRHLGKRRLWPAPLPAPSLAREPPTFSRSPQCSQLSCQLRHPPACWPSPPLK